MRWGGEVTGVAEEAARLLVRFGRRYAAAVRLATLVPICAVALFRASPEHFAATASMVAVAAVWTCGYVWWLRRGPGGRAARPRRDRPADPDCERHLDRRP
ncbi:hypothetical protein ACFSTC_01360 [Nonomuraea ferruginea]